MTSDAQAPDSAIHDEPLWLFAYGSLIWRPGFHYEQRVRGFVPGHVRRFWQVSTDHRGTPASPGRVVTLVPRAEELCWGVSYRVSADDRERVLSQLDVREKGGYSLLQVDFVPKDRQYAGQLRPWVYIARPGNPNYAGETEVTAIADIVRGACGPSGHNVEYVLRLAEALSELEVVDEHVFELANLVADPEGLIED